MTTSDFNSVAQEFLTSMQVEFVLSGTVLPDFTVQEIVMGESLLTQSPQTALTVQSYMHSIPSKNWDAFKNAPVRIRLKRKILEDLGLPSEMEVEQTIYRIDNRHLINQGNEEFTIHAIDSSMLDDAENLVSKSWKCVTPSVVVRDILSKCVNVRNMDIEDSVFARDYIAENIHPYQAINQQSTSALTLKDSDPSFLHFMTYENGGTHHFKSLKTMTEQTPTMMFQYSEQAKSFGHPQGIMTYSFPCDFDLLSDILNGYDRNGNDISSLMVFNPRDKTFSLVGNQKIGCGIGSGVFKMAATNINSAKDQNTCISGVEKFLQKRQARMSLIERDKIALRFTVPWNPSLNAGKTVEIKLLNKNSEGQQLLYGSGKYLILHLTHNIKRGGFATTTMDCVADTVGQEGKV